MNTGLSQLTLDTLAAFARRRRTLIAMRGLCAAIVALLGVMSLIALIDGLIVLRSQPLRWALSLAGYGFVLLVVWVICLRSLLRIPGSRELARFIEQREPGLREDLLSAVELGASSADGRFDSPQFRALLQASVEAKISRVEVGSLLPSSLIRGSALLAAATLMVCIALLLTPDLHFAGRLTRAFLPSAPVDRIASVKVKIIAPEKPDLLVPHNEAVNIIIELTGGEAEVVMIETLREDGENRSERLPLKPAPGERRFAGVIQMGRGAVRYRILAGDAVTRLYTIDTAARPHPVQFAKTYHPPAYTDLPSQQATEKHGHLEGLAGTKAQVIIETDQPIRRGELRFDEADGVIAPIPLEAMSDSQWRATIPMDKPMLYKVHLVSARTGFDNALDPPFEIKTTPDFPPRLAITAPEKDMLLPPAAPLRITLIAGDDLGLDGIHRHLSINGGAWARQPLATRPGRDHRIDETWELYDLNLQPGDQLAIRFSASDRAGQITESPPVTVTLASGGFDPQRMAGLEAKRRLLDTVRSLRSAIDQEAAALKALPEDHAEAGPLQRKQILTRTAAALQSLHDEADQAWKLTAQAMKVKGNATHAGADDLLAIGRALSRLRDQQLAQAMAALKNEPSPTPITLDNIARDFSRCIELAQRGEAALAAMLAVEEADALLRDLLALKHGQQAMNVRELPDQKAIWRRLSRRQLLAVAQLKQTEDAAMRMSLATGPPAKAFKTIIDDLAAARAAVEKQLAREPSKFSLLDATRLLGQGLDEAIAHVLPLTRSLLPELSPTADALRHESLALHQLTAPLLGDSIGVDDAALRAAYAWTSSPKALASSERLAAMREDGSPLLVADIALFRRAFEAIRQRGAGEAAPQITARLVRISQAMRTLEAGHELTQMQLALEAQAASEKWMRSPGDALTHGPLHWQMSKAALHRLKAAMEAAPLPASMIERISRLPQSAAATVLDVEMTARRYKAAVTQKRTPSFEQLAGEFASLQPTLSPLMAQARATLAAEIPSLHEQLAQLATQARALQKKAEEAREQVTATGQPLAIETAQALGDQQQAMDQRQAQLEDALRHDADAQDLFTAQGRERARDADDAAAMVRDAAAKARQAIEAALAANEAPAQEKLAAEAAAREGELAATLDQLAKHYENLEAGEEEKSRSALRQAESDLGIKRQMDAQYGRMEKLARLAELSPEEQQAQLEKEAATNQAMRKELSEIAREAVAQAKEAIQEAAGEEARLAEQLADAHKIDQQPRPDAAKQIDDLSEQARSLAKKIEPIAQQAGKSTAKDAAASARAAGQSLEQAAKVQPPAGERDHQQAAAKARELADALSKAAGEITNARQQAEAAIDRLRKEESEATAKLAVGSADADERQQAAETLLHSRSRQEAAKRAAAAAKDTGKQADALAQAAQKMAADLSRNADAGRQAIADAKEAQPKIADSLAMAQEDLRRAARHEERIDNRNGSMKLTQSQEKMQAQAGKAIDDAAKALAKADTPAAAQPAVEKAGQSLKEQADALNQLMQQAPADGKNDQPSGDDAAAKEMARALDALDRAQSPSAGGEPSPPETSPEASSEASPSQQAAQAMKQAAQAQARAMTQVRQPSEGGGDSSDDAMASKPQDSPSTGSSKGNKGKSPGGEGEGSPMAGDPSKADDSSSSGGGQSGSGNRGDASPAAAQLPQLDPQQPGDWGRLPPRLARELLEGRREEVAAEYRRQVEAYFRAIARKARGN